MHCPSPAGCDAPPTLQAQPLAPPHRPPAPRCKPYPRAEPVGHAAGAPPWHAGCGHHLLLRRRLGPGGDDAHCGANRNARLNPQPQGPRAGSQPRCRVLLAGTGSPLERDPLAPGPYPCSEPLASPPPAPAGSAGAPRRGARGGPVAASPSCSARSSPWAAGESRFPVRPRPAWGPCSAWGQTCCSLQPRGDIRPPQTLSREWTDTQTPARRYQCTPNVQGEGAGRALQLSPPLCPSLSGLGTDRCPHRTGSCVGKASCSGDDPSCHGWEVLRAPGQGHPASVLSSSKIPHPREGTGSQGGRTQSRERAKGHFLGPSLPASPGHSPPGARAPVQWCWYNGGVGQQAQCAPLSCPGLLES